MNILVTGSISYDEIMDFPHEFKDFFHPEKLHQINISFVVDRLEKQLGGTATNIAYNTSLVTNNKVSILSSVGKDGQEFIKFFKKNKIDTSAMIIDKKLYTTTGKVITDIKDNQIWGFYYGAGISTSKINIKKYINKNTFLIISAAHPDGFLKFQREAIRLKVDYLYDPGMSLTWISDSDLIQGVLNSRYLIGNDYEMAMITKRLKKTVGQLTSLGINVVTTLGEKGVRYEGKAQISNVKYQKNIKLKTTNKAKILKIELPAYKVKKVVDPTGAGDAWRGGFIAGLTNNMKIEESLKLGNVMASFAIEKYGTVNHHPNKKEIAKRLKSL